MRRTAGPLSLVITTSCPAAASSINSPRWPSASFRLTLIMGTRIPLLSRRRQGDVSKEDAGASRDLELNVFQKILMVDQLRGSWNSLLTWLRDVQAWSLAADVIE